MILYAVTIFLGAFLLFVVQPLTARRLLPWFGGSPAVWIVALMFFQTTLLIGYAYAHVLTTRLARKGQVLLHGVLLLACLAFLPVGPDHPPETLRDDPTWDVLALLVASLLVPLVALSSTNPLLQRWLSTPNVYRLFAVSNLGSLLGLWCYPFVFEPWKGIDEQVASWSFGFGLYAVCSLLVAARAFRAGPDVEPSVERVDADFGSRLLWLGLSATGTVLLMGTSNQLTRNVAAVPFLWVLPLSLYLLSFIVAFERDRWYVRWVWVPVYLVSMLYVVSLLARDDEPPFIPQLVAYSVNLFAGCLVCHGELARLRPKVRVLTSFYLHVALGGALGGAFVTLAAPVLFRGFWEYPLGLFAVYVLGGISIFFSPAREELEWEPVRVKLFFAGGAVALGLLLTSFIRSETVSTTLIERGFFGVLRVYDRYPDTENWERYLWNGPISHGGQLMAEGRRSKPILYYGPGSGIALALDFEGEPWGERGRRIGVVGLGTGSLASLARPDDDVTFYELNPDVVDVARRYFYYLSEAPAHVTVEVGDGRRALANEIGKFDILVIDAFSGDAIPVHLLTREAFELYDSRLAENGILAVHISNLHFDLRPVVRAHAEALGAVPVLVQTDADEELNQFASDWMLLTRNAFFLSWPELATRVTPWRFDEAFDPETYRWTDDYSNLFGVLK